MDEHGEPHRDGTSRRDFLRAGGAAAAGVVAGGVVGDLAHHHPAVPAAEPAGRGSASG
ncbi:twin-arginine translocation signal domain-containing protein [Homoserinibacter gongjuensis]|uniref:twin-arginine translocation signal domain-containing protein n=1 Tax=Homoserinibacter gongjuensis TaxID=1162968 RepID=UPI003D676EAB